MSFVDNIRNRGDAGRLSSISKGVRAETHAVQMSKALVQSEITAEATKMFSVGIDQIKTKLGFGRSSYGFGDGSKYPGGISGSGSGIFLNHAIVRQNARVAYHDSPQAKAIVDRYADTVADIGLKLDPTPIAGILGISQEEAELWGEDIAQRFDLFARDKGQHRSGRMTFYQTHRLYAISQQRDNDMFVRFFYSGERSLMSKLQFEFIDPNQIVSDGFTDTFSVGLNWHDGIERDSKGKETGYNIWFATPNGQIKTKKITARNARTGRINMIHGFSQDYVGQGRGYSRLAHAIQDFKQLADFQISQILKAISQSQISMYVKPSEDAPASNTFEDMINSNQAGPQTGNTSNPTSSGEVFEQSVRYCDVPEAANRQPGSIGVFNLQGGEDLKTFGDKTPPDSFDSFVGAFTSYLAASMSMPLEVLLMKFNANYSASRATLILFWRVAKIWREEMATDYLNPLYEMWLSEEIAAGRISAPGFSDPTMKRAWLHNTWIGAPQPNIDPKRTADADMAYATMGGTDLDRIARELNGSSGKSNRAKLARQYEELPPSPFNGNGNGNSKAEEKEDE